MIIYSLQIDHIDINRKLVKITKFVSNVSFIKSSEHVVCNYKTVQS